MADEPYRLKLLVDTTCNVGRKMQTAATKLDDDAEMTTCTISIKGVRVSREAAEEMAGLPIGTLTPLFNELGTPKQHMSITFPKRELLTTGRVEHRKDSGAKIATLDVTQAVVSDLRFRLDVPDGDGPTVMMSHSLTWKAAGDEVEHVRYLLGPKKTSLLKMTYTTPPEQVPLAIDNDKRALADKPAGDRAKLDRKRQAAGEKPPADDDGTDVPDELLATAMQWIQADGKLSMSITRLQSHLKIGYNRAARILEALEVLKVVGPLEASGARKILPKKPGAGAVAELEKKLDRGPAVGPGFMRDAAAAAAKGARRPPPKPAGRRR